MIKTLIVLAGPTASGKTDAGIELASHFQSEIISADSRQIYIETEIGTAVPDRSQLEAVKHHFIQCVSLETYYNASIYEYDVLQKLKELFKTHDIVFMVGGSGLYINAVCFGIDDLPSIDPELRKSLTKKYEEEGLQSIRNDLKILDPVMYDRVDLKNHLRILKALEVTIQTGKPYSSFLKQEKRKRDFNIIHLALDMDRTMLYERINTRVDQMIEKGLLDEASRLEHLKHMPAMKTVGYREIFSYLDNKLSLEEAIDLIKRNTRKYARKQLTWFRKDKLYPWFEPDQTTQMLSYINKKLY